MKIFESNSDPQMLVIQELAQIKSKFIQCCILVIFLSILYVKQDALGMQIESDLYIRVLIVVMINIMLHSILFLWIKLSKNPKPNAIRILIGQIVDCCTLGVGIINMGTTMILFYPIFLNLILGNAMRYGIPLMFSGVLLSLGTLSYVFISQPFWHTQVTIAVGLIAGLIVTPFYLSVLVKALTKARDKLVENEKQKIGILKQIDDLKTTFFANISHEFRTPIALSIGSLDLLERDNRISDPAQVAKQHATIRRNQNRLLQLINQILDLEKLEQSKFQLKIQPIHQFADFLYRRIEQFRTLAEKKSLDFKIKIDDEFKANEVFLDPEQLDKVIFNLLSNALKFTKQGSISVSVFKKDNRAIISVKDSGIGIKPDQIGHIFERFRQASGSESKDYAGTGIGLSLVQEIVHLHGGEIEVTSEYGHGTQFTMTLKLGQTHLIQNQILPTPFVDEGFLEQPVDMIAEGVADSEGIEKHKSANDLIFNNGIQLNKKTILYVDDNYELRDYFQTLFNNEYNLLLAADGLAALSVLEKIKPDLILSDLMMPRLDGLGLLKKIRENSDFSEIPFIILTAKSTDSTKLDILQAGADDYLNKPFSADEITLRIRNMLLMREQASNLKKDLLAAKLIQRSLLPPLRMNFSSAKLSVLYQPCETLSGDFFDIFSKNGKLFGYVADVTSHGTSAAQITYLVKSIFKNLIEQYPNIPSPAFLLAQFTNQFIDFILDYGVGMQLFVYDETTKDLDFAQSNAPSGWIHSPSGLSMIDVKPSTLVDSSLAAIDMKFFESRIRVEKGTSLFCMSDGSFEFLKVDGHEFSERQLLREIQKVADDTNWEESLLESLKKTQGSNSFADDITILRLDFL